MNQAFFSANRQRLRVVLPDSVIVITAYKAMQQSNDASYPFAQEANFWYLCGINEPDWTLVIDGKTNTTTLFSPDQSKTAYIFNGGLSDEEALAISGADEVISARALEPYLRKLAKRSKTVYTFNDKNLYEFVSNPAPKKIYDVLAAIFSEVDLCNEQLAKLRALKQPEEIRAITRAVNLTIESFEAAKKSLSNCNFEYQVEAVYWHHFRRKGAYHAYEPIIASGVNACTLHYAKNSAEIDSGQLILIDVGARVDSYAADITRTYAKDEPTKRQRAVHSAVQSAHHDIIDLLKPGLIVEEYSRLVDERMKAALKEVGLLKNHSDSKSYRRYFPHAISHGLGIDVHDSLGGPEYFQENMVLTVEPGIYIPEEGIGVRIEDDILITATGHRNLSSRLSTGL